MEVYSRPSDPRLLSFSYIELDNDGSGCTTNSDRYMKINVGKCENKDSQMECPAMADGETNTDPNTRKLPGFLMLFYCSQSLSISKLFYNGKNLQAEKFIFYY